MIKYAIKTIMTLIIGISLINSYASEPYDPESFYRTYLEGVRAAKERRFPDHDCDCRIEFPSPNAPSGKSETSCTYMQGPQNTNFVLTVDYMLPNIKRDPVTSFLENDEVKVCFGNRDSFPGNRECTFLKQMVSLKALAEDKDGVLFRNINSKRLPLAIGFLEEQPKGIKPAVFGEDLSPETEVYTIGGYSSPIDPDSTYHDVHLLNLPPQQCIKRVHLKPENEETVHAVPELESDYNPRKNPNHRNDLPLVPGESGASLRSPINGSVIGVHTRGSYIRSGFDVLKHSDIFLPTSKVKKDILKAVKMFAPPQNSESE